MLVGEPRKQALSRPQPAHPLHIASPGISKRCAELVRKNTGVFLSLFLLVTWEVVQDCGESFRVEWLQELCTRGCGFAVVEEPADRRDGLKGVEEGQRFEVGDAEGEERRDGVIGAEVEEGDYVFGGHAWLATEERVRGRR